MTDQQHTPETIDVRVAYRFMEAGLMMDPNSKPHDPEETAEHDAEFDRWLATVEAAAEQRGAARELRKFAHAQDTWCEEGRAEQRISRIAMRDALLDRADRVEGTASDEND